jgi:hypothetical protein
MLINDDIIINPPVKQFTAALKSNPVYNRVITNNIKYIATNVAIIINVI